MFKLSQRCRIDISKSACLNILCIERILSLMTVFWIVMCFKTSEHLWNERIFIHLKYTISRKYVGSTEFRPKEFSSRTFGPDRISGDFSDRDKIPIWLSAQSKKFTGNSDQTQTNSPHRDYKKNSAERYVVVLNSITSLEKCYRLYAFRLF